MYRFKSPFVPFVALVAALASSAPAFAVICTDAPPVFVTNVNQLFASGSRWRFNVYRYPCEGLVIHDAYYTPRFGTEYKVLYRSSIAQIQVPYETDEPRFQALTTSISGLGNNALSLAGGECPGGVLYDGNRVCKQVEDRGYAWKFGPQYQRGQVVSVFMSSQLGQYNYVNQWNFQDDGVIEPRLGLTGRLQMIGSGAGYLPHGQRLDPEGGATPVVGISHNHNIYYRFDFDINGAANNAVDKITLQPSFDPSPDTSCATSGQCFVELQPQLMNETVDYLDPTAYTSWRIYNKATVNANGRAIGYELVPDLHGLWNGMVTADEPWSSGELWVTHYNGCHLLAFDNHPPHIPAGCAGTEANDTEMATGAGSTGGEQR